MRPVAVLAAAALLALAGCGGDDTDDTGGQGADQPLAMVQQYLDAFASGDYAGACARITAQAMEDVTEGGKVECAEVYEQGGASVAATRKEFAGAKAQDPQIDGDRGSVGVRTESGQEIRLPVLREDGEWKVGR